MKRHRALLPLSDDHHRALVLARRARRAASLDDGELELLARDAQRAFDAELEPHFRVEEDVLLPVLAARCEELLRRRTADDHGALRSLARVAWTREVARAFGERLEKHVRFEERVLFPRAESLLSEAELEAVFDAVSARFGAA